MHRRAMFETHGAASAQPAIPANDEGSRMSLRKTVETFIASLQCDDATKTRVVATALDIATHVGKSHDSEMRHVAQGERVACLVVYTACVRSNVIPPYHNAAFASRMHTLLRSKHVQKFLDEVTLKCSPTEDAPLRDVIVTRGCRCIKYVERAFRAHMPVNSMPRALFYAMFAIWTFFAERLAAAAGEDARTLPSALTVVCVLMHECVAASPCAQYVSDNSSFVFDQILNIVAGTRVGVDAIPSKHRAKFTLNADGVVCHDAMRRLCALTTHDAPALWKARARAFRTLACAEHDDPDAVSDALDAVNAACALESDAMEVESHGAEVDGEGRVHIFCATPLTNVTVSAFPIQSPFAPR